MVVVVVICVKTGAGLPARKAAGQREEAGLLHMASIVATLAGLLDGGLLQRPETGGLQLQNVSEAP